jgi:hypothetical protein
METDSTKRIIEVNGIKLEVDLRNAKVIDFYKVGDPVKILKKNYSDYSSYLGMIVGFDEFQTRPTIIVAYLKADYTSATIEFTYINSETKDCEICPINNWDVPYTKQTIIDRMDKDIEKKQEEIREMEAKKNMFLIHFGKYFEGKVSISESI